MNNLNLLKKFCWSFTGISMALLYLFCGCQSGNISEPKIVLAANGKSTSTIVVPKTAPYPVQFAAEELREYLDKITGADFKITHIVPKDKPAIVLGEKYAEDAGIDVSKIKRDGFAIQTIGNKIYIAGKDDQTEKSKVIFEVKTETNVDKLPTPELHKILGDEAWDFERGTVFGTYDFLEKLGVRWFFPTDKGEVVPSKPTLSVSPINEIQEPSFDLRYLHPIYTRINRRYLKLKVINAEEFKTMGWTCKAQKLWSLRNRASSKWMAFNHRPARHKWAERFGKTHPEYFALLKNGKRATGPPNSGRAYLNYTSKGMLEETVADMDAFFSGKKPESRGLKEWHNRASYGDTFSLLPDDGLQVDHSPESQKYINEERKLPFRHTNYIWQFVDKAGRRLKDIHPDKKIINLAYQSYFGVPDPEVVKKLPDNVIVGIAALSGPSSLSRRYTQKESREQFAELLESWSKVTSGNRPMLFWNYWLYRKEPSKKNVPMILPHLAKDFVRLQSKYGKYMFIQMISNNFIMEHLNKYVMYRLLWNPDLDMDELLDDYCNKFYGPGATPMREFFSDLEEKCLGISGNKIDIIGTWENYFNEKTMKKYKDLLQEADNLTKGTKYQKNVKLISTWILDKMIEGRANYLKNIKDLKDRGAHIIKSYRIGPKSIKINGKIDKTHDNRAWWLIGKGRLLANNANGRYIRQPATVRIRHSDQSLYFCFDITEPDFKEMMKKNRKDYVEIFLDTNNDKDTYYWLYITPDGKKIEHFHPGPGEPPNDWNSQAKIVTATSDKGWVVEVEIPLKSIDLEGKNLEEMEIGALCCLTRWKHQDSLDFWSSTNPILRGAFHQPGMFGRLRFVLPGNKKRKKRK